MSEFDLRFLKVLLFVVLSLLIYFQFYITYSKIYSMLSFDAETRHIRHNYIPVKIKSLLLVLFVHAFLIITLLISYVTLFNFEIPKQKGILILSKQVVEGASKSEASIIGKIIDDGNCLLVLDATWSETPDTVAIYILAKKGIPHSIWKRINNIKDISNSALVHHWIKSNVEKDTKSIVFITNESNYAPLQHITVVTHGLSIDTKTFDLSMNIINREKFKSYGKLGEVLPCKSTVIKEMKLGKQISSQTL